MAKSLSRKGSPLDKKAEVINPLAVGPKMTRLEAEGTLATEFVFANARRQAQVMADGCGSEGAEQRLKHLLLSVVLGLEILERVLKPAADRSCAVLGLPNNHALRDDLRSYTRLGMNAGGVVQQLLGKQLVQEAVTSDGSDKVGSLSPSMVSIEVDGEGVVRESTPDALVRLVTQQMVAAQGGL